MSVYICCVVIIYTIEVKHLESSKLKLNKDINTLSMENTSLKQENHALRSILISNNESNLSDNIDNNDNNNDYDGSFIPTTTFPDITDHSLNHVSIKSNQIN